MEIVDEFVGVGSLSFGLDAPQHPSKAPKETSTCTKTLQDALTRFLIDRSYVSKTPQDGPSGTQLYIADHDKEYDLIDILNNPNSDTWGAT